MSEIRPEVVERVFQALTTMSAAPLLGLTHVTAEERAAAEQLAAEAALAAGGHRDRRLRSIELILSGGSPWPTPPSWSEAFDALPDGALTELRELYWDMPDAARSEFDGRFGRPTEEES